MEGTSTSPLAPGSLVAGRYRLERVLGHGAMGAVFEASGPGGAKVAVKAFFRTFSPNDTGGERARFQREAAVCENLSSDHLVRVRDHGFDPGTGTPFIVMDLLEGEDLESAVMRVGPLEPRVASTIILQACRGLEVAHAAGVIHRDIKPPNIFLQTLGDELCVKICDFGVAKVIDENASLTATGSVLGSPLFMAPEQFVSSKRVDERSDVWSMAMSLYAALAGKPAFHSIQTFAQLVVAVSEGKVPRLQEAAPWVSAELATVVHGGLIAERASRCPSIREFAAALEAAAAPFERLTPDLVVSLGSETRAFVAEQKPLLSHWNTITSIPPEVSSSSDPLLDAVIAERYRLERVLGRGGMGAVYEAVSLADGSRCALKIIRPDLSEHKGREAIRRFVREAKASQDIDSPYVARILDAGADEARGLPYLAMELLRGHDLGRLVKEHGPLEPDGVVSAFVQACAGLSAAHARGIVHRDIKPANLFLHETPTGDLVAKVCDFGVAKQVVQAEESTELTRTGSVLGSPMYMSPEQAQNAKNVDHRSDIWSLGISLYEALSGQKAWEGSTMGELILAICTRQLQPLQELAPWVKPELAEAVHRATERDPARRFQSAEQFGDALRAIASRNSLTSGDIRGVSPERRRTSLAARSSSGRITPVADATALAQASVISIDRPSKSRTPLVAALSGLLVLAGVGTAVVLGGGSGADATASSGRGVHVGSQSPPVVAAAAAPTPSTAEASPSESTAHADPPLHPATTAKHAPSSAPSATSSPTAATAATTTTAAATAPKPAPSAPAFKTTW